MLDLVHEERKLHTSERQRAESWLAAQGDDAPSGKFAPCAIAAGTCAQARSYLRSAGDAAQQGVPGPNDSVLSPYRAEMLRQAACLSEVSADTLHPYVIFCAAKALWFLDLCDSQPATQAQLARLKEMARKLTEHLVAQHALRDVTHGESVALAYCAATLSLHPADDYRYIETAVNAALSSRSYDGAWPEGRLVTWHLDPDTGGSMNLTTHDVAATIAETFSILATSTAPRRPSAQAACALVEAMDYAQRSAISTERLNGNPAGWSSTHAYGIHDIDVSATAAVLRLATNTRRVAERQRQADALGRFADVWDPVNDFRPPFLEWQRYREHNEPDRDNPILEYLNDTFVELAKRRIREDPRPWARTEAMSVILFGPPGTTKTTIVKAMADGLGWPLVTLSPGTFVEDGLDNVERRTSEVFAWLRDLNRAVVLFDECDELFRARNQGVRVLGNQQGGGDQARSGGDQARSITAFLTASMLPKLQDLRDRGQIFFVIATNYFDQIDSAVRRVGRIDALVGVGWPDETQRKRTIEFELERALARHETRLSGPVMTALVDQLAEETRYFVRGELVAAAATAAERHRKITSGGGKRVDKARTLAKEICQEIAPSMSNEDQDQFRRDAAQSSVTHAKDRGELRE